MIAHPLQNATNYTDKETPVLSTLPIRSLIVKKNSFRKIIPILQRYEAAGGMAIKLLKSVDDPHLARCYNHPQHRIRIRRRAILSQRLSTLRKLQWMIAHPLAKPHGRSLVHLLGASQSSHFYKYKIF
jgi:hypothetical protein